jgi:hypothetical protein
MLGRSAQRLGQQDKRDLPAVDRALPHVTCVFGRLAPVAFSFCTEVVQSIRINPRANLLDTRIVMPREENKWIHFSHRSALSKTQNRAWPITSLNRIACDRPIELILPRSRSCNAGGRASVPWADSIQMPLAASLFRGLLMILRGRHDLAWSSTSGRDGSATIDQNAGTYNLAIQGFGDGNQYVSAGLSFQFFSGDGNLSHAARRSGTTMMIGLTTRWGTLRTMIAARISGSGARPKMHGSRRATSLPLGATAQVGWIATVTTQSVTMAIRRAKYFLTPNRAAGINAGCGHPLRSTPIAVSSAFPIRVFT